MTQELTTSEEEENFTYDFIAGQEHWQVYTMLIIVACTSLVCVSVMSYVCVKVLHAVLDGDFPHNHDETAWRISKRTSCGAGITLGTRPYLLLHRIIDTLKVFRP